MGIKKAHTNRSGVTTKTNVQERLHQYQRRSARMSNLREPSAESELPRTKGRSRTPCRKGQMSKQENKSKLKIGSPPAERSQQETTPAIKLLRDLRPQQTSASLFFYRQMQNTEDEEYKVVVRKRFRIGTNRDSGSGNNSIGSATATAPLTSNRRRP